MSDTARQTIYRPDCNRRGKFPSYKRNSSFYIVTQGHEVAYAYFGSYYTVGEVIHDVVARNEHDRTSLTGQWASMDFVVWHDDRIMAVVHQDFDDETGALRIIQFDEKGNRPDRYFDPFYGWPDHDEWVGLGRPETIVLTPEDMERNRAREDLGKDIRTVSIDELRDPFDPDNDNPFDAKQDDEHDDEADD